jgi:hypothetical protein
MADLADETREALLTAIKEQTAAARNTTQLEQLATAYAFTVGGMKGRLPGGTQYTISSA